MFLRFFIILFFAVISFNLHAQTNTRAVLNQQIAFYKKECTKNGYTLVKESKQLLNKTNLSTIELSLQGGNQYLFIAFVDCDFCDLKMHYWNNSTKRKIPIYPKEAHNLNISVFNYYFTQATNSTGRLETYVNAKEAYFGHILIYRKAN